MVFPPWHKHTFELITSTLQPNISANSEYILCSLIYMASPLKERKWQKEEIIYNKVVFQTRDEEEALLMIRWAHQGDCLIGRDRRESRRAHSNNIINRL